MKNSNPAITKASNYLNTMLQKGVWKPGDKLPSIRMLAKSAGVSPVPMWRAVNSLADDGTLEVIQGSGVRVKPYPEEPSAQIRKGWVGLRDRIHKDILCGFYPPDSLMPTLKEMRVHYGVSFRTLKKALDNLEGSGSITQEFRTYRVVSFSSQKATAKIVLLGWCHPQVEMQTRTPWGEEFLRTCENLCSGMRLNLCIYNYSLENGVLLYKDQEGNKSSILNTDDTVVGYLLWAQSPDELYREVISRLNHFKKPVAVLQEGSQLRVSDLLKHNRSMKIFSIATGTKAAQNVATFLVENGHKKIAYISPFHKSDWSKARYHGLQEIYSRLGSDGNVYPFTIDSYGLSHEFRDAIKHPDQILKEIMPTLTHNSFPERMISSIYKMGPTIHRKMEVEVVRAFMQPLLTKALQNEDCTAWVCASDYAAFIAMDFLDQNNKKIALIGFDDTFEAFRRGLTSYNFNIRGLVQAMLSYIINPSSESITKSSGAFEIEGMLVKRRTSFKV
ncbi:GntR family transcriptional regulator [Chitinispirillales bacterium ANBcel5]|uniref:GntR family transcriptional regulator n=1 Tax=Cellulosispirillum alkaliphilum TaxID=3039283 RepID=UPI002A50D8BD|nr:GntR family transcriptional regulator [Chitinispirillales bacterium ANBcel5]